MKSRFLLLTSLAVNIGCAVYWLTHRPSPVGDSLTGGMELDPLPVIATVAGEPAVTAPSVAFHWDQIKSSDPAVYLANLRAIGCPEQTIQEILPSVARRQVGIDESNEPARVVGTPSASVSPRSGASNGEIGWGTHPYSGASSRTVVQAAPITTDTTAAEAVTPEDPDTRERKKIQSLERMWLVDSIRARYGIEALLSWQHQAVAEGLSFEQFIQRHLVQNPR